MLVQLEGGYRVERVAELKAELLACLCREEPVELSLSGVDDVDPSFFLLLQSAVRTYEQYGKSLVLRHDLPARFRREAAWAGFPELVPQDAA